MATTQLNSGTSDGRGSSMTGNMSRQEKLDAARTKFAGLSTTPSAAKALSKNDPLMAFMKSDSSALSAQDKLRELAGLTNAKTTSIKTDENRAKRNSAKAELSRGPDLLTMPDTDAAINALKTGQGRTERPRPGEELTANEMRRRQRLEERKLEDQFKPSVIAKILPSSVRAQGMFWLSQIGAFARSMVKGRYNRKEAIKAYEMVQSIL
jgi:hypothetical protein